MNFIKRLAYLLIFTEIVCLEICLEETGDGLESSRQIIAVSSDMILMDEPFSALDLISRNSLQELVLSLHEELGTTFSFVMYNMEEAIS